jgi:hypothetical protein
MGPKCTAAQCVMGDWAPWMPCTKTCDGGTTNRTRTVITYGPDQKCEDNKPEQKKCGLMPCSKDCTVEHWSSWSLCQGGCEGTTQRVRSVLQNTVGYGQFCPALLDIRTCADQACLDLRANLAANASANATRAAAAVPAQAAALQAAPGVTASAATSMIIPSWLGHTVVVTTAIVTQLHYNRL